MTAIVIYTTKQKKRRVKNMSKQVLISPSTDPCPLADLLEYSKNLIYNGADWLHCDIMDGKFVPAKTFDEIVLSLLSKRVNTTIDVHLMVENPLDRLPAFARAGANVITVHFEAIKGTIAVINTINKIHELGCKAGLAIKPDTKVSAIENYLPFVDLVLVMSVEPGKSGQQFMINATSKIAELNAIREREKYNYLIEVDGGINKQNAGAVVSLGADVLVLGSAMYSAPDKHELIRYLKSLGD